MANRRDRQDDTRADMRTLTLTLTVSLFIALMAFFIVLNSFSAANSQKQISASSSLKNAFGYVGDGQAMFDTHEFGAEHAGSREDMEGAAAGLRSALPDMGFQSRSNASGSMMVISVKRDELEDRWPALRRRLGDLLMNKNQGRYSVQFVAMDGSDRVDDLISKAQQLSDDGVHSTRISVGYEKRNSAAVELRFTRDGQ